MAVKVRSGLCETKTIKYSHASATTKDTIYLINGRPMLAVNTALAAAANTFVYAGRIEYAKATGAWTAGDDIYWDNSAGKFTKTQAGNSHAGVAAEDAASGAANGIIDLTPTTVQSV